MDFVTSQQTSFVQYHLHVTMTLSGQIKKCTFFAIAYFGMLLDIKHLVNLLCVGYN